MLPEAFIERVTATTKSLVVFSVVRNERQRILPWLRHYRQAGVEVFAIIDNGSTDGTCELLQAQPDVVCFQTLESFGNSNFGLDWLNEFHSRIKPMTWVLFADADELLLYRGWPRRSLQCLAAEVASQGGNAVFGFMLDMYPGGSMDTATLRDGDSLFDIAPYYDGDYVFRQRPLKPWEQQYKAIEVIGGPRVRMLSSIERERSTTWFNYFMRGQVDRVVPLVPDAALPWCIRMMPKQMPALEKVPLVRSGTGFHYINNHRGSGGRVFHESVVFAHFKFLADFAARVRVEANRGEHYRRGAEYMMYADAIRDRDCIDLRYAGSRRFESVDDLIGLNIIRDIAPLLT